MLIFRQNPNQHRAWLWVAVTPSVTFFQVMLSRSTAAAKALLGENFSGLLNSDRYNAYNWVALTCIIHEPKNKSKKNRNLPLDFFLAQMNE